MVITTDSNGNLVSSSTPVVAAIRATSTTATSTFAGVFAVGSTTPQGNALFVVATTTTTAQPSIFVNKSTGDVGIGTNAPTGRLEINGGNLILESGNIGPRELSIAGGRARFGYSLDNQVNGGLNIVAAGGRSINFNTISANATGDPGGLAATLTSGGKFGIGTNTPTALLSVAGSSRPQLVLTDINAGTNLKHFYASSSAGSLTFGQLNDSLSTFTEFVRIGSNGFFGIGTTSPGTPLAVNGSGVFDGNVFASYFTATSTTVASSFQDITFARATGTSATTTSLAITGLSSTLLKVNSIGGVVAAVAGTDYMTSGNSKFATSSNGLTLSPNGGNSIALVLGGNATTTNGTLFEVLGNAYFQGSTTLQNFTALNSTTTNATTTNFFATNLVGTTGLLSNLLLTGSTTLQNFTFANATGTSATTTNFFATNFGFTTATGTTLSASGLGTFGNLLVTGSSTLQNFTALNSTTTNGTTTNLYATGIVRIAGKLQDLDNLVNLIAATANDGVLNIATNGGVNKFFQVSSGVINVAGGTMRMFSSTVARGSSITTASQNGAWDTTTGNIYTMGQLGLGTSSPLARLDVAGANNDTAPLFQLSSVASFATTTRFSISNSGDMFVSGSTTLRNFTALNSTTSNATTTTLSATTASTTNLIVSSAGGTAGCATFSSTGVLSNTGVACGTGSGSSGANSKFATSSNGLTLSPNGGNSIALVLGGNATTTDGTLFEVLGNAYFQGSTTLQNFTALNSTTTNATSTNFFATNLSATNFNLSGIGANMVITTDSNGNLVSSSTPVVAAIKATSTTATSTFAGVFSIGSTSPMGNADFVVSTTSNARPSLFVDKTNGRVGVGTTAPLAAFSVQRTNATDLMQVWSNFNGTTLAEITAAGALQVTQDGGVGSNLSISSKTSQSLRLGVGSGAQNIGVELAYFSGVTNAWSDAIRVRNINSGTLGKIELINAFIGAGTSTPYARLGVWGLGTTSTSTAFQVANNASTTLFSILDSGTIAVGTTSPWGGFAINPTSLTASSGPAFVVGSSTATNFIIDNAGKVGINTTAPAFTLDVNGQINASNLSVNGSTTLQNFTFLNATGTNATTTNFFATLASTSNLYLSTGSNMLKSVNGLVSVASNGTDYTLISGTTCTGTDKVSAISASGAVTCSADQNSGGAGSNMWATSTSAFLSLNPNGGNNVGLGIGTSTPAWALEVASSTRPQFALSDASLTSDIWTMRNAGGNLYFATSSPSTYATSTVSALTIDTNGNVGIATTSPFARFAVQGTVAAQNFFAYASTSTTTLAGGLDVNGGAILHDWSTGLTSIDNLQLGITNFDTDAGILTWVDMPVTAASALGTVESYTAQIDGNPLLTVYSQSDGAGGIRAPRIGVGTTTPSATFTVWGTSTDATLANFVSNASSSILAVLNSGNVGINTTAPAFTLDVNGQINTSNLSVTGSSTLQNFTALNATTSKATTTSLAIIGLNCSAANQLLQTDANGSVICGTDDSAAGGTTNTDKFATSSSAFLSLNPNGGNNVGLGIGTSTPAWALEVASSTRPQFALSDASLRSFFQLVLD
jgi:hypothetical protein